MKRGRILPAFLGAALLFALGASFFGRRGAFLRERGSLPAEVGIQIEPRSLKTNGEEALSRQVLTDLYSENAVLMDAASGRILEEKKGDQKIYPASLTKIMTALLAVEEIPDLDASVQVASETVTLSYARDASTAGFSPEETVTYRDLLYGVLLPSGAECCLMFARQIAGTEEAFAERMNERAAELGLEDTHFCNSTGLHDRAHYSTAADLARLLQYALQNETFREVFTSSYYSAGPTEEHPDGLLMQSTLSAALRGTGLDGSVLLGGKTGYTEEAGLCLASLARIGEKEYLLVTAGAKGSHETEPFHVYDALAVYNRIANP